MAENPGSEVKALLEEQATNPTYAAISKQAIQQIDQSLAKAVVIGSGDSLLAEQAQIGGEDAQGAYVNPNTKALSSWRSPETWFIWQFKVKEAGNYGVEVIQAYPHEAPSDFAVIVGDQELKGASVNTTSSTDFTPVEARGTLALEPGKVYTLVLFGRGVTQPRMMDVSAVKLTKK